MKKITFAISVVVILSLVPSVAIGNNKINVPNLQQTFGDDGEGPPVEDPPPAPINDWIPYCMILGLAYIKYKLVIKTQRAESEN